MKVTVEIKAEIPNGNACASRANRAEALRILKRAGKGNPPVKGDELPPGLGNQETSKKDKDQEGQSLRIIEIISTG